MAAKKAQRIFRKLSNVEHVRLRTGMWLGQNSLSTYLQHFFIPRKKGEDYLIEHREIEEIPAKWKCLDEACMNSVDEYNRNRIDASLPKRQKMRKMEVRLSDDREEITVLDNGRGIPEKNAEAVFLHLMYGENFDDKAKEDHVAGQNGVGISLVRIVSKFFRAETHHKGRKYAKIFTVTDRFQKELERLAYPPARQLEIKNYFDEHGRIEGCAAVSGTHLKKLRALMRREGMIESIEPAAKTLHGTKVTFCLEQKYFNDLDVRFSPDLLCQYLQDIAMTNPGLEVSFIHGRKQKLFHFPKGMEDIFTGRETPCYKLKYRSREKNSPVEFETYILAGPSRNLTWINSNFASLGGSPIEYMENRICDEIRKKPSLSTFEKKLKTTAIRNDVRNCFHMYHNWHILHPRFKSQDKSYLINDLNEFIRAAVDEHLDKMIRKLDLVNAVKAQMEKRTRLKSMDEAERYLRRASRTSIPKLIPPVGRPTDPGRILFIAEGDSAIAGLRPVRNPAIHGLFPLRGKPLNVKNLSIDKAMKNEEIKNLISIIDLPLNGKVKRIDDLNYERVSIITDADYDGYAIRSLILSLFFEYWPELYRLGFIHYSSSPLYEVELLNPEKKKKIFFCLDDREYEALVKKARQSQCVVLRKKRNKGLGESSRAAMKYTVENGLTRVSINDLQKASSMQELWFDKDLAAERRRAIAEYAQLFFDD